MPMRGRQPIRFLSLFTVGLLFGLPNSPGHALTAAEAEDKLRFLTAACQRGDLTAAQCHDAKEELLRQLTGTSTPKPSLPPQAAKDTPSGTRTWDEPTTLNGLWHVSLQSANILSPRHWIPSIGTTTKWLMSFDARGLQITEFKENVGRPVAQTLLAITDFTWQHRRLQLFVEQGSNTRVGVFYTKTHYDITFESGESGAGTWQHEMSTGTNDPMPQRDGGSIALRKLAAPASPAKEQRWPLAR